MPQEGDKFESLYQHKITYIAYTEGEEETAVVGCGGVENLVNILVDFFAFDLFDLVKI